MDQWHERHVFLGSQAEWWRLTWKTEKTLGLSVKVPLLNLLVSVQSESVRRK